jgi:large subunit ribosomal protein L21
VYAVIEVDGHQFRVQQGEKILVDGKGTSPSSRVLMIADGDKVISDRAALDKATLTLKHTGEVRERQARVMRFKTKEARSQKRTIGGRRVRQQYEIAALKA